MQTRPSLYNWLMLMALVALWGTSFMFNAIAVDTVDPVAVVFYRLALGAVVLGLVIYARGESLPLRWRAWAGFFIMAIAGNALPFFLIAWGQQSVDSGVAGMIMAIMPLLTMVLAHYTVENERLNRYKLIGFTLGITGVVLLLGPVFEGGGREFWSGLAIFCAALSYAVNTILIKRLPRFSPMVGACGVLLTGSVLMFPFWLMTAGNNDAISQNSMFSVIWLGIGPTGVATIVLFAVVDRAGPTFLSTINYLIPAVAFFCGAWLLDEPATWLHFAALAMILGGIGITRMRAQPALH